MLPPAIPGLPLRKVDTPALIIDLDAFERNLNKMAIELRDSNVRLRAHSKTHKSPVISQKQIALGACGICCQKVSEAEVFVCGGIDDILISNQVVGQSKLDRLAALAKHAKITVCVDDIQNIRDIALTAEKTGCRINILVEIDVGAGRCGVTPGKNAVELAKSVQSQPNLYFAGLQAYHGTAQHLREPQQRQQAITQAAALTAETVEQLTSAGINCDIVSGAGTGTYEFETASGVYNEVQAGSYIFLDLDYSRNRLTESKSNSWFEHSLLIYTTIMSVAKDGQAVVDAGLKSVSVDSGLPEPLNLESVTFASASDEHGVLKSESNSNLPELGSKIFLVPGHCDPTVNLHDWYVGVRDMHGSKPYVETLWPVAARGCIF